MLIHRQAGFAMLAQPLVLADGDIFHLRGDDALARVVHLADILAGTGTARNAGVLKAQAGLGHIAGPLAAILAGQPGELLGIITFINPG